MGFAVQNLICLMKQKHNPCFPIFKRERKKKLSLSTVYPRWERWELYILLWGTFNEKRKHPRIQPYFDLQVQRWKLDPVHCLRLVIIPPYMLKKNKTLLGTVEFSFRYIFHSGCRKPMESLLQPARSSINKHSSVAVNVKTSTGINDGRLQGDRPRRPPHRSIWKQTRSLTDAGQRRGSCGGGG